MKERMVSYSVEHPWTVFGAILLLTGFFGSFLPSISIDTDPENMLPSDQADRVFYDEVKERFGLYDGIVVGVVNDADPDGVFNPTSLANIHELSTEIQRIDGVIRQELISPSTVDNIQPNGEGAIRFEWLLSGPPADREAALAVRDAAQRLPTLDGFLISEDGRAIALYVPITQKNESYRIATEIETLIEGLGGNSDDAFYITGLPTAEDTFGVQMFHQMAISAPLAGLVIFLVMGWFFRSLLVITAPMILAMATVVATVGLLIGLGFDVHIMSSMIPIFLMPIAVVDSVHVLSEFADRYRPGEDARQVITEVMHNLFRPMLFTSLTSAAGFASLGLTPIPPVQVFGIFVAFGILLAFVLTVTFIPAYISVLSPARLEKMTRKKKGGTPSGLLALWLRRLGDKVGPLRKLIVGATLLALVVSGIGISQIVINDNPVRWFHGDHPIRVADDVLNAHFGGTYPAYLILEAERDATPMDELHNRVAEALADPERAAGLDATEALAEFDRLALMLEDGPLDRQLVALTDALYERADDAWGAESPWSLMAEEVEEWQIEDKVFQTPEVLAYITGLQAAMAEIRSDDRLVVGNSISLVELVKTVYRELRLGDEAYYAIPETSRGVAQTILSFQSSHRPTDLNHFVTPDYRAASIWIQLKSGDNQDMIAVERAVADYMAANPPPQHIEAHWSGATHINLVWQGVMVAGMGYSLLSAFLVVFIMMVFLFRSLVFGLLSMVPLTVTMAVIYGIIGLVGKDYDMPVAVLSSLALGLSIDFAIHFLERSRMLHAETGSWSKTLHELFEEPGRAISRNAIVIAIGFTPLLLAPLVPYNTVGILMAAIMAVSGVVTIVVLPAIMSFITGRLFSEDPPDTVSGADESEHTTTAVDSVAQA